MPSFLTIILSLAVAYLSTFIYYFVRNYVNARKTGFPSIVVPWDQNHVLWMIASVPLRPILQKYLPRYVWDRLSLTIYGWEFFEKLRPFEDYSSPRGNDKSFMLVGCGKMHEFSTRDPEIILQILGRPRDFMQLDLSELFMAKFGHNVLTTNGDRWARQRKVVAGVINERISKAVFTESIKQTEGLLAEVDRQSTAETTKIFDMIKKITIHVLIGAGMGASVPFQDDRTEKPEPGYRQTYIQTVKIIIHHVTGLIIVPQWITSNYPSFLPGHQLMKNMSYAVQEFPIHTKNMLQQERQRSKDSGGAGTRNNIMSQLLQAGDESVEAGSEEGKTGRTKALSEEEMIGNLFIFTAAGFDTTANTVSYALALLARYPKWQEWLFEEIDAILPNDPTQDLDYVATFPKVSRLLALMFETLRIFTPLIHIAKQTRLPQTIHTSHGSYWLPANTQTYIDAVALHLDPKVWRNLNIPDDEKASEDDERHFRPSRWVNPAGSQQPLFQPPKATFVPWSAGPRVCPGQKMAQVEFVAIFLTLLRQHRIEAVPIGNESQPDVEKRLDARMRDSMSILTLQMNNVYDVSEGDGKGLKLRLSKRQ